MRVATLLLAVAAAVSPGLARAEDNPACARFEEPLAYNACLASHGPKAKDLGDRSETSPRGIEPDGARRAASPTRARITAHAARGRSRVHMEFRVR